MVLAKDKNKVGLGNALMNSNFGGANKRGLSKGGRGGSGGRGGRRNGDGSERYQTKHEEAGWVKMRSITEQQALDEFLSTAELADTDFTAEKMNVKIIHNDQKNPFLLSPEETNSALRKHRANAGKLTVPRRPAWNEDTTPAELERSEKESFLAWRRGLADLQEEHDLLLTPFERNLEVWRQLWRVIERSDLVVQIVDARNPLTFRSEDLENYVKEVDERKNNLLLVNKADMMTLNQRKAWAEYFKKEGIKYTFFSAALAKQLNEENDAAESSGEELEDASYVHPTKIHDQDEEEEEEVEADDGKSEHGDEEGQEEGGVDLEQKEGKEAENILQENIDKLESTQISDERHEEDDVGSEIEDEDPATRIITVDELERLFLEHAPKVEQDDSGKLRRINIGLVGYPNVGKSSTINALIGAKKVSVSSTPGKTKHFQTIHLSDNVMLVDCPGLVFPNFATMKADLVCNGVLPIDQLREFLGPAGLVAQRIPRVFLEAMYGIQIHIRPLEEGGTGEATASEVLVAYARARGFTKTGTGRNWDESRAARYVLKDYVNGKLLYVHPPPADPPYDPHDFNLELYDIDRVPEKRREAFAQAHETLAANADASEAGDDYVSIAAPVVEKGKKSTNLDKQFFKRGKGGAGQLSTPYQYVSAVRPMGDQIGPGKELSGRKARAVTAMDKGIDLEEMNAMKQHFKAKREKRRTDTIDD